MYNVFENRSVDPHGPRRTVWRWGLPISGDDMDKRQPTPPKLPPRPATPAQPAQPSALPPLPSLDRSAQPPAQPVPLTGPVKMDSLDSKLAVQMSLANDSIPVKFTQQFPCGVHPCLNYTNVGMIGYDLTFQMYRISIICPECQRRPRP